MTQRVFDTNSSFHVERGTAGWGFSTGIGGAFALAGGLGAGLSFYGI